MKLSWIAAAGVALFIVAAPASADLGGRKASIDAHLGSIQNKIDAARAHAAALQTEIASTTARIRGLEARVGDVSTKLASLQSDLALRQHRLEQTDQLFRIQTQQLGVVKQEQAVAQARLRQRLIDIYESDPPTTLDVIIGSNSVQDALDRTSYFSAIAAQDQQIVRQVSNARTNLQSQRRNTRRLRDRVRSEERLVAYRAAQEAQVRGDLLAAQGTLVNTRDSKSHALAGTQAQVRDWQQEASSLAAVNAQLEAQIAAAQAQQRAAAQAQQSTTSSPASPSPSTAPAPPSNATGLVWPVSGPITSPFGMRWGSLHPGIDIGVGYGTPIHAAAAGRVLVASYDGGYGNLVVLDNGNSISTAYAHQSSIAVTVGQSVSQGQVIGYVGSTGFSTGPHLHFEVRINGTPVDPLGYL